MKQKAAEELKKQLTLSLDKIEKTYGKGSIMRLGDGVVEQVPTISTGSLSLDLALGIMGYPTGRIVEIYGPESSGKTTLAIHAIAEAQKSGGLAAFIDAEHAFDKMYAKDVGVDVENLYFSQPDNGEQALDIVERLAESGSFDVIVVDSVAALVPRSELEGEMGDSKMGLQARLMSQAMRKLTAKIAKAGTCLIFINQIREKIGVMFGNPETTTGGNALKFYSSVRLEIRAAGKSKSQVEDDERVSNLVRVNVVKNKLAPPFKKVEFYIRFGVGIDRLQEVIDFAVDKDIIEKKGSWYSYQGTKIAQGEHNVRLFLNDNPELLEEIEEKVIQNIYQS